MTAKVGAVDRAAVNFTSVDSAPRRFAGKVPAGRAPKMLFVFCALTIIMLWAINNQPLAQYFPNHDLMFAPYAGKHAVAIRLFIFAFFISFAAYCGSDWKGRLFFALDLVFSYAAICSVLDLWGFLLDRQWGVTLTLHFSEIISGLIGFAVFSFKLLERGQMPVRIRIEHRPSRHKRAMIRLILSLLIAAVTSSVVAHMEVPLILQLREVTLLGGIGPGVFLFIPTFFAQLYLYALWDNWHSTRDAGRPPVSIIVPAYNESYIIARTIRAIEKAAVHYGGEVNILIMNNNSSDDTAEIAWAELDVCEAATGRVIDVPTPGKSHALNAGLEACETEILVRVDADTQLGEDNLTLAIPYFADPAVGLVGGVPIPPGGGMFDRARLLEVIVKHGFYSVAMGAVNGLVGIPGMFVIYRTQHLRHLGGFVEGMNGEDTDISLRIGEMGYHSVIDPAIRYISEVPTSYEHMREQRMRWFRSVYHISSRCRDLIYSDWMTLRGKVILPYMLINSARRTMLVPLILFGFLEYCFGFNPDSPLVWQSVVAVMTGAPAIMAVVAALLNKMPRAILALPEYLLFRLLRSYFTLESMMSISISQNWRAFDEPTLKDEVSSRPIRIA